MAVGQFLKMIIVKRISWLEMFHGVALRSLMPFVVVCTPRDGLDATLPPAGHVRCQAESLDTQAKARAHFGGS